MTTTPDDQNQTTTSPWLRPRFVVSAVVVALILVLGVVLATGLGSGDKPTPTQEAPTAATTTGGAANSASSCRLPAGDQTVPRVAPANTRWQLVGTMAAPTAPSTYGPGSETSGVPTCFAHSPTGALYAAVNFVATTTDPTRRRSLTDVAASAGIGRDAALARLSREQVSASASSIQLAGFNVLNYEPQSMTADLLLRTSSGALVHLTAPMTWESETWKWVLPPSGDAADNVQSVPSSAGYVLWSGA